MTFESVVSTLESEFENKWKEDPTLDVCPIHFGNVDFNTKRDSSAEEPEDEGNEEQWCRFVVSQGDGDLLGLGAAKKMYRYVGFIFVSVFTPEGLGTQSNKKLCQRASNIFRSKQFTGNISCLVPSIQEVGVSDGWWQVNVNIPFYWDEFL